MASTQSTLPWIAGDWLTFARLDDAKHAITLPTTLTTFLDESNPRPGTADLYFSPNPDQSPIRATMVDYTLVPRYGFSYASLLSSLALLAVTVLIPLAPIYCGWRVYTRNRWRNMGSSPIFALAERWLRFTDPYLAISAIAMGILGCISLAKHLGVFLGKHGDLIVDNYTNFNFDAIALLVPGTIFLMCISVLSCGLYLLRMKTEKANGASDRIFYNCWWQGIGVLSLFAGGLGLLASLPLVFHFLDLSLS